MFNEKSLNFSINQFRLLLFEVKGHISCLIQNFSGCLIAGTYLLSTQQILTRDGQTHVRSLFLYLTANCFHASLMPLRFGGEVSTPLEHLCYCC